jgi:hypothetical protein
LSAAIAVGSISLTDPERQLSEREQGSLRRTMGDENDARIFQNARCVFDLGEPALASAAARRVINQQRVFDLMRHRFVPGLRGKRALYNIAAV